MRTKRLRWDTLREAVAFLMQRKSGCFHYTVWDDGENDWAIVVGFMADCIDDPNFFGDGRGAGLYYKIAYQPHDSGMQCDFGLDWEMPYNEDGEVDDTCTPVWKPDTSKGWRILADEINETANRVVNDEIDRRKAKAKEA